jgi:hypothetical protein
MHVIMTFVELANPFLHHSITHDIFIVYVTYLRIPKKVLNGKFHNTRPVGRPRIRWEDAVQKDALQILGTRRWWIRAENREEWRQLLREAKARKGL